MRKPTLLVLTVLLSAPALAWVPKLEETTAKNVIDGAYGRRDPVPTYQTLDLTVKDGKFAAGEGAVRAFDGGDTCLTGWLAAPTDYSKGSRPVSVTVSGQADQLYFQAVDARDNFRNLSAADALGTDLTAKRMPEGQLRVDVQVRGLPSDKARAAYLVRLRGPVAANSAPTNTTTPPANGTTAATGTTGTAQPQGTPPQGNQAQPKVLSPVRSSYVNDFKKEADGTWSGTLVYYFEPLKAGIGASDRVELLLRTEADTNCAYSVGLNLGSFQ